MGVGVMRDSKIKREDPKTSDTLGSSGEDRDEVNRREVCECDGCLWVRVNNLSLNCLL